MNKIMLIGNLGKDPEMSYTNSGTAVTKFSLAVNRGVRNASGEWENETDWFNIVAWERLAERCNTQLRKGNKVFIEGRLSMRKYTDRDNIQRTAIDVVANQMETFVPKGQSGSAGSEGILERDDTLGDLDDHPF